MMKTLCVAVVLLSLISVGQPATLACEKLLKPADTTPALSGSWYIIAISTESCLVSALLNSAFWPSIEVDFTPQSTANLYSSVFKLKLFGHCANHSENFLHVNSTLFEVDSNNAPTGDPDVLLQNSCPDCMSLKGQDNENEIMTILLLLSKRKTISAAELKEFESQAECLSWSKPLVLDTDHNYENCTALDDDNIISPALFSFFQRLTHTYTVSLSCLAETLLYHPNRAYKWVQQNWNSIW